MKILPAIKKLVTTVTCFSFACSGIFLLSGAGTAWSRILIGGIFLISILNLILPLYDLLKELQKKREAQLAKANASGGGGTGGGENRNAPRP